MDTEHIGWIDREYSRRYLHTCRNRLPMVHRIFYSTAL